MENGKGDCSYHTALCSIFQNPVGKALIFAGRPSDIAKAELETIKSIFADDKLSKQVHNAAKRISKKRGMSSDAPILSLSKRSKPSYGQPLSPAQLEESLELPEACYDEDCLSDVIVHTNRAPLVCCPPFIANVADKMFAL